MKRITWIVVVIAIAIGLVLIRMKRVHEKEDAAVLSPAPVAVSVAQITQGSIIATRHVLGHVLGTDETEVAPRVMAQVIEVSVREGDVVRKDELLATLDPRELQDAASQAEAGVQAAKEGLVAAEIASRAQRDATARDERLFKAKAISQEQWDGSRTARAAAVARLEAAKTQVEVAQKSLDQAETRVGYTRITAPFRGVVAARLADPGDLAVPGRPLVKLVRQQGVRVRAEVPPKDFPSLHVGQAVTLSLGEHMIQAAVSRVFPAMGVNHLAAIEADLANPPVGFISGATVGVDIHLSTAEGLSVPTDALLEGEKGSYVFTIHENIVHPVKVQVLSRTLDAALVSGNVQEGESVIVARPSRLMTFGKGTNVLVAER